MVVVGFASVRIVCVPTTVQHNSYLYIQLFSPRHKNEEYANKEPIQELSYQISMVLKSAKSASPAAVLQAPSIPSRNFAVVGSLPPRQDTVGAMS